MYVKVERDRLTLPTGGGGKTGIPKRYPTIVVAQLTEPAPEHYREVAISRDARGNYYASFVAEAPDAPEQVGGTLALDLGIKTLATGVNEHGRVYTIGGFKGHQWDNRQLDKIRPKRDRFPKKSPPFIHRPGGHQPGSEVKRNHKRALPPKPIHAHPPPLVTTP